MQTPRLFSLSTAAILVIATGSVSMASAQERERAEKLKERLAATRARLNLTDEQIEQIRPILRAGIQSQIQVLEKHGIDIRDRSGERRSQLGFRQLRQLGRDLDAVREQTVKDLGEVLSDAQITEYKQIQKERKSALRKRLRQRRR